MLIAFKMMASLWKAGFCCSRTRHEDSSSTESIELQLLSATGWQSRLNTINTTRKATVAYPTVKRLLFHLFYATHPQKLLKSHEMVWLRGTQNTGSVAFPICVDCRSSARLATTSPRSYVGPNTHRKSYLSYATSGGVAAPALMRTDFGIHPDLFPMSSWSPQGLFRTLFRVCLGFLLSV